MPTPPPSPDPRRHLLRAARAASGHAAELLVTALDGDAEPSFLGTVPAIELLSTYRVRLRRCEEGGGPATIDLRPFVDALAGWAAAEVELVSVRAHDWNLVAVRYGDHLAVTAVAGADPPSRPDARR